MTPLDDRQLNALILSTANALSAGASEEDIAQSLVAKVGNEWAFLIFGAAKAFLRVACPYGKTWCNGSGRLGGCSGCMHKRKEQKRLKFRGPAF